MGDGRDQKLSHTGRSDGRFFEDVCRKLNCDIAKSLQREKNCTEIEMSFHFKCKKSMIYSFEIRKTVKFSLKM
jgi:hypothetical protein